MTSYRRSTSEEVQRIFNEQMYWERVQGGEFTEHILWQGKKRRKGDLRGLKSQTVEYRNRENRRIALVHQNVHTNGRIRGRPDPITLLHHGVLYDCSDQHR